MSNEVNKNLDELSAKLENVERAAIGANEQLKKSQEITKEVGSVAKKATESIKSQEEAVKNLGKQSEKVAKQQSKTISKSEAKKKWLNGGLTEKDIANLDAEQKKLFAKADKLAKQNEKRIKTYVAKMNASGKDVNIDSLTPKINTKEYKAKQALFLKQAEGTLRSSIDTEKALTKKQEQIQRLRAKQARAREKQARAERKKEVTARKRAQRKQAKKDEKSAKELFLSDNLHNSDIQGRPEEEYRIAKAAKRKDKELKALGKQKNSGSSQRKSQLNQIWKEAEKENKEFLQKKKEVEQKIAQIDKSEEDAYKRFLQKQKKRPVADRLVDKVSDFVSDDEETINEKRFKKQYKGALEKNEKKRAELRKSVQEGMTFKVNGKEFREERALNKTEIEKEVRATMGGNEKAVQKEIDRRLRRQNAYLREQKSKNGRFLVESGNDKYAEMDNTIPHIDYDKQLAKSGGSKKKLAARIRRAQKRLGVSGFGYTFMDNAYDMVSDEPRDTNPFTKAKGLKKGAVLNNVGKVVDKGGDVAVKTTQKARKVAEEQGKELKPLKEKALKAIAEVKEKAKEAAKIGAAKAAAKVNSGISAYLDKERKGREWKELNKKKIEHEAKAYLSGEGTDEAKKHSMYAERMSEKMNSERYGGMRKWSERKEKKYLDKILSEHGVSAKDKVNPNTDSPQEQPKRKERVPIDTQERKEREWQALNKKLIEQDVKVLANRDNAETRERELRNKQKVQEKMFSERYSGMQEWSADQKKNYESEAVGKFIARNEAKIAANEAKIAANNAEIAKAKAEEQQQSQQQTPQQPQQQPQAKQTPQIKPSEDDIRLTELLARRDENRAKKAELDKEAQRVYAEGDETGRYDVDKINEINKKLYGLKQEEKNELTPQIVDLRKKGAKTIAEREEEAAKAAEALDNQLSEHEKKNDVEVGEAEKKSDKEIAAEKDKLNKESAEKERKEQKQTEKERKKQLKEAEKEAEKSRKRQRKAFKKMSEQNYDDARKIEEEGIKARKKEKRAEKLQEAYVQREAHVEQAEGKYGVMSGILEQKEKEYAAFENAKSKMTQEEISVNFDKDELKKHRKMRSDIRNQKEKVEAYDLYHSSRSELRERAEDVVGETNPAVGRALRATRSLKHLGLRKGMSVLLRGASSLITKFNVFAAVLFGIYKGAKAFYKYNRKMMKDMRYTQSLFRTSYNESSEILAKTKALSETLGAKLKDVQKSVYNISQAFGLSAKEAEKLYSKSIGKGANVGENLMENSKELAFVFAQAGATGEEFFTMLAQGGVAIDNNFTTALSRATMQLNRFDENLVGRINRIGLNGRELQHGVLNGTMTVMQVLDKLARRFEELKAEGRLGDVNAFMTDVFGSYGSHQMTRFMSQLSATNMSIGLDNVNLDEYGEIQEELQRNQAELNQLSQAFWYQNSMGLSAFSEQLKTGWTIWKKNMLSFIAAIQIWDTETSDALWGGKDGILFEDTANQKIKVEVEHELEDYRKSIALHGEEIKILNELRASLKSYDGITDENLKTQYFNSLLNALKRNQIYEGLTALQFEKAITKYREDGYDNLDFGLALRGSNDEILRKMEELKTYLNKDRLTTKDKKKIEDLLARLVGDKEHGLKGLQPSYKAKEQQTSTDRTAANSYFTGAFANLPTPQEAQKAREQQDALKNLTKSLNGLTDTTDKKGGASFPFFLPPSLLPVSDKQPVNDKLLNEDELRLQTQIARDDKRARDEVAKTEGQKISDKKKTRDYEDRALAPRDELDVNKLEVARRKTRDILDRKLFDLEMELAQKNFEAKKKYNDEQYYRELRLLEQQYAEKVAAAKKTQKREEELENEAFRHQQDLKDIANYKEAAEQSYTNGDFERGRMAALSAIGVEQFDRRESSRVAIKHDKYIGSQRAEQLAYTEDLMRTNKGEKPMTEEERQAFIKKAIVDTKVEYIKKQYEFADEDARVKGIQAEAKYETALKEKEKKEKERTLTALREQGAQEMELVGLKREILSLETDIVKIDEKKKFLSKKENSDKTWGDTTFNDVDGGVIDKVLSDETRKRREILEKSLEMQREYNEKEFQYERKAIVSKFDLSKKYAEKSLSEYYYAQQALRRHELEMLKIRLEAWKKEREALQAEGREDTHLNKKIERAEIDVESKEAEIFRDNKRATTLESSQVSTGRGGLLGIAANLISAHSKRKSVRKLEEAYDERESAKSSLEQSQQTAANAARAYDEKKAAAQGAKKGSKEYKEFQIASQRKKETQEVVTQNTNRVEAANNNVAAVEKNATDQEQKMGAIGSIADSVGGALVDAADYYAKLTEMRYQYAVRQREIVEGQYQFEDEMRRRGLASNAGALEEELKQKKRQEAEALKKKRRANKMALAANQALTASNLILGTSKMWAQLGVWAPPAIAAMWAAFAASTIMAHAAASKSYGKGGFIDVKGGSHASGHDVTLGEINGIERRVEGGESIGIFSKKAQSRYGNKRIRSMVDDINNGRLQNTLIEQNMVHMKYQSESYKSDLKEIISILADTSEENIYFSGDTEIRMKSNKTSKIQL